ncbi:MAG: adenylate/guanylate cyclase domain-containing protein [Gammaproteobacteria bacterium]|nr:adenylate/guanylate cyclase domain-containing protein [Gammaproteobacteria bacterium]
MNKTSCAIMFVDISGSTRMYEKLGDEIAKQAIDKCLAQLSDIVVAQNGSVIKSIGDELMCRFDNADSAIAAAVACQVEVGTLTFSGLARISIRAAVHFGQVIEDENDIFGDAVNVAARMTGISRAGQILTTEDTVNTVSENLGVRVRQIDLAQVKGKENKIPVYEVLWEQQDRVTRISQDLLARMQEGDMNLRLTHGADALELNNQRKSAKVGRSEDCDFVVDTALASRVHAIIELRRDKFFITDQGTNGTYVSTNSGQEVYLRREEFILHGNGKISLGQPFAECDGSELVYFECR